MTKKNRKSKVKSPKIVIGVVDTMFARYDMGAAARDELASCPGHGTKFTVLSATVPGFKDLAVAAKNMIERDGADIVVALGMPGGAPIDKQCAHEASTGIMSAQLMTSTPILEVFVHEDESEDPAVLREVFERRSRDHARNAYWMLFEPEELAKRAGQGVRQGFADAGPLGAKAPRPSRPSRPSRAAKSTTAAKSAPAPKASNATTPVVPDEPPIAERDEPVTTPAATTGSSPTSAPSTVDGPAGTETETETESVTESVATSHEIESTPESESATTSATPFVTWSNDVIRSVDDADASNP